VTWYALTLPDASMSGVRRRSFTHSVLAYGKPSLASAEEPAPAPAAGRQRSATAATSPASAAAHSSSSALRRAIASKLGRCDDDDGIPGGALPTAGCRSTAAPASSSAVV
jgi:hypothetical protein